ncbi:hypothetical protein SKAU_G00015670 [Synaphobranchus kaupii]|uniref:Uncharacterized protein n=1 Tax=Synaphobranchus kaupii TaxID=118154 RepID=A0A9Q1JDY1_SYNKA|nr:hypothetical protein SKAU_G00015670 [Synaphobranchus kaupii]
MIGGCRFICCDSAGYSPRLQRELKLIKEAFRGAIIRLFPTKAKKCAKSADGPLPGVFTQFNFKLRGTGSQSEPEPCRLIPLHPYGRAKTSIRVREAVAIGPLRLPLHVRCRAPFVDLSQKTGPLCGGRALCDGFERTNSDGGKKKLQDPSSCAPEPTRAGQTPKEPKEIAPPEQAPGQPSVRGRVRSATSWV